MNVGANFFKEHVLDGTRIQYVITNGGQAAKYSARVCFRELHPARRVTGLSNGSRGTPGSIAKGAAMMTDTTFEEVFESGFASNDIQAAIWHR